MIEAYMKHTDRNSTCLTDRPVTYLYNTLHYYERKLRDKPALKRKLVQAIIGRFFFVYG